ncbi:rhodanese-like domain-containing protein [Rhizosphaericola mali]|nr:rhodanese-like domain-containing protein [Rhizosphaericola mali]
MKSIAIVGIVLISLCFGLDYMSNLKKKDQLQQIILQHPTIIDVRTEQEFQAAHIKGAINIPLESLNNKYTLLNKNTTYITTCSHGIRSKKALYVLQKKGFQNVFDGGAWLGLQNLLIKK